MMYKDTGHLGQLAVQYSLYLLRIIDWATMAMFAQGPIIKLLSEYAKHRYIYRLGPSVLASLVCYPQVDPRDGPANCFCTDKKGFSVGWSVSSLLAVRQHFLCNFLPFYRLHSSIYWQLEKQACFAGCAQTLSDTNPTIGKIHPLSKIAVWTNNTILISFEIYNVLDLCNIA